VSWVLLEIRGYVFWIRFGLFRSLDGIFCFTFGRRRTERANARALPRVEVDAWCSLLSMDRTQMSCSKERILVMNHREVDKERERKR